MPQNCHLSPVSASLRMVLAETLHESGIIPRKYSRGMQKDTWSCAGIVCSLSEIQTPSWVFHLHQRTWTRLVVRSDLCSAEWFLELKGIQRPKGTARVHPRGLVLHSVSTVVLGLILFCEEWCKRRTSKRQATELNSCCSSLHPYPLFCFFRFEREAKRAVEACGKMTF